MPGLNDRELGTLDAAARCLQVRADPTHGTRRRVARVELPDEFDIDRPNLAQHVTFVQGPHACLGLHVARAETHAAIDAALDWEAATGRTISLDAERSSDPIGLIFRKPLAVTALSAPIT